MWKAMGTPAEFHAVEIGAGIGYVCNDIFDYLHTTSEDGAWMAEKEGFLNSLRYCIIEPFAHFQSQQKKLLRQSGILDRVTWMPSLEHLSRVRGCIFSNELLDAFPVHVIEMHDQLKEVYVNHDGDNFHEELHELSTQSITGYLTAFAPDLHSGYRTEVNLTVRDWLRSVSESLSEGYLFTIDYGYTCREYFSDERTRGTLLCYHQHLFNENPYQNIGSQDITAHVNFSSLRTWGDEFGFTTLGYCPQGTYLVSAGIDEVITELYSGSPDYLKEVSKVKGLIMPQGMGESHNVMIQYKGAGTPELRGFSMRNLAESL
jgi:SAM-dependent MidA family methyltransferase